MVTRFTPLLTFTLFCVLLSHAQPAKADGRNSALGNLPQVKVECRDSDALYYFFSVENWTPGIFYVWTVDNVEVLRYTLNNPNLHYDGYFNVGHHQIYVSAGDTNGNYLGTTTLDINVIAKPPSMYLTVQCLDSLKRIFLFRAINVDAHPGTFFWQTSYQDRHTIVDSLLDTLRSFGVDYCCLEYSDTLRDGTIAKYNLRANFAILPPLTRMRKNVMIAYCSKTEADPVENITFVVLISDTSNGCLLNYGDGLHDSLNCWGRPPYYQSISHRFGKPGAYTITFGGYMDADLLGVDSIAITIASKTYSGPVVRTWTFDNSEQRDIPCPSNYAGHGETMRFFPDGSYTYDSTCTDESSHLFTRTGYFMVDSTKTFGILLQQTGETELIELTDNHQFLTLDEYGSTLYHFEISLAGVDASQNTSSDALNAFPNPFYSSTSLSYSLQAEGKTHVSLYDELGRAVRTIAVGRESAGNHTLDLNATNLPTGVYHVVLTSGSLRLNKQLVLSK